MLTRVLKMSTNHLLSILLCILYISTWMVSSEANFNGLSDQDLKNYMQDVLAEYQLSLRRSAFENAPRRKRRSLEGDLDSENRTKTYQTEILEIIPWATIPTTHPVELDPFTINNEQYLAAVNFADQNGNHATKSSIYKLNITNQKFDKLQDFDTSGAVDFHYVDDLMYSYAIFVDKIGKGRGGFGESYQQSFQLNQYQPEFRPPFQYRSRVGTLGATQVNVFDKGGYKFFVTANSYSERGNRYQVQSTLHVKLRRGFQLLQSFETLGAQDVEVALIDNRRYIFFANHEDNSGSTDIYSYVYKEKEEHELTYQDNFAPYGLYQRIPTHGAIDLEYFEYNGHHYLVSCNEYTKRIVYTADFRQEYEKDYQIESVIYWWTGNLWVEWQRVPTNGAVKATYFRSEFGDPMLVIANSKAQATIYTYDVVKGIFKPTTVQGLSPQPDNPSFIPDVRSVSVFNAFNETFLTVANYALDARNGTNIFKLNFVRNETEGSAQTVPQLVEALLKRMKEELIEVKEDLETQLNPIINQVLTKTTEQTLDTELRITGNHINITTLETEEVLYTGHVTPNPIKELAIKAAELREKVTEDEVTINNLQEQMSDLVELDQHNVTITGEKTFQNIEAINVVIDEAQVTGLVDGTNITDLHQHGLQNNTTQTITGQYSFNQTVNFTQDVTVENQINELYINEILTTTSHQNVTGALNFTGTVVIENKNLQLYNNTINGIRMDQVMTTNVEQTVTGLKTFTDVVFRDLQIDGNLDSVDVSDFDNNKVSMTGPDTLSAEITFANGFNVSTDITVGGLVDGTNITALWQSADVDQNVDEEIHGSKVFQNVTVRGHCNIESVNGKHFDNLALKNEVNNFTGKVIFNENVTVYGHLVTTSTINNLNFQRDLVRSNSSHVITGYKMFDTIYLMENLTVHGNVNNVDLEAWVKSVVQKGANKTVTGQKHFHSTVNILHLQTKLLNDMDVEDLLHNLLILANGTTIDASLVEFQSLNMTSILVEGTINGLKIPDDLVLLTTDQHIEGSKSFSDNITILNIHNVNVISHRDFSIFLNEAAQNLPGQIVEANVTFENSVRFTDEITTELLNGRNVDDWITTNTNQSITGTIRLLNNNTLFATSITTDVVNITGKVNGIDISDLEASAIYKNTSETINNTRLVFINGIDCKQNLSIAGLIDGVNLTELYHTTVRISKNQTVSGQKVFTNTVTLHNTLATDGTINNINLTKLDQESLKTVGHQTLPGNVTFQSNVVVNGALNTDGSINGISVNEFLENAAFLDSNGTVSINGSLTFSNVSASTVHTTSGINSVLLTDILLQGVNQTLSGNVTFNNVSTSSVVQTNSLNGKNITDIARRSFVTNGDQNITGKYEFSEVHVEESLVVQTINGVNLQDILESAVPTNKTSTVEDNIRFTNDVIVDQLETSKSLGGVNITQMLTDALTKTGNQLVCHRMAFENLSVKDAEFKGDARTDLINDVNVTNLYFDAVYLYQYTEQEIKGRLQFEQLIVSEHVKANKVNGFDLSNDFMLTSGNQTISSNVTFTNTIVFESNLKSNGLIDGVNLTRLNQERIDLFDNITISGLKRFQNATTTVIQVTDSTTINGILPSDLVEINKPVVLSGVKSFTNLTVSEMNVTGKVNGVDLVAFNELVLRRNRVPFQLQGNQFFTKDLIINGNLNVTGYINDQLVNGDHEYKPNVGDEIQAQLDTHFMDAGRLCGKLSSLATLAVAGAYLEGIEMSTTITLPSQDLGPIQSTIIDGKHYVSIARSEVSLTCGLAYILECATFPSCTVLQSIQTNAVMLEFFLYNNKTALLVDHKATNASYETDCTKTTAEIYLWSSSNRIFEPYQTVNEDVMESENAPIMESKGLIHRYLNKQLKDENLNGNSGKNQTEIIDSATFQSKGNKFVIASIAEGSGGYIEVLKGSGNNVGSLMRSQRIVINSGRKNYVSVGKLRGQSVVSISSNRGQNIKFYRLNSDSDKLEFYQQLPRSATSVKFQKVKQSEFVLFASPETGFGLCPWQGVSGFAECEHLKSTDNKHVDTITTENDAFVIIGNPDSLKIYRVVIEGSGAPFDGDVC